ncbi:unnamed protein product, partial [Symbiodinium natans]
EEALLFVGLKDNPQHLLEERTLLRRLRQLQLKLMLRLLEAKWVEYKLEMALVKATSSWSCKLEPRRKTRLQLHRAHLLCLPFAGATSSSSSVRSPLVQNRAEKYLPSLPMLEHQGMNKGRMREVETWHAYLETLSSWLALQDESFVRELQLCVKQKNEILQKDLADVAARSAKLYYYLTQSLSRWERGRVRVFEDLHRDGDEVGTLTGSTSKGDAAYVCASLQGSDMEIDSLPVDKEPRKDITAGPSILKKTSKEAKSDEKPGKDEKSIRKVLSMSEPPMEVEQDSHNSPAESAGQEVAFLNAPVEPAPAEAAPVETADAEASAAPFNVFSRPPSQVAVPSPTVAASETGETEEEEAWGKWRASKARPSQPSAEPSLIVKWRSMLRGPRFRYFMQAIRQQREDLIACGYPVPAIPENNLEPAVPLMSIGDGVVYPSRQGTIFASLTDALMTDGYLLEVGQKLLGRIQRPDPDVGPCLGTGWSKRLRDHDPDPLDGTPYISAEVAWALWLPEFPEAPEQGGILPVKRKRDFSQLTDELLDEHTTRFELAGQGRTLHQRGVRARDARAAIEGYTPDPSHLRHQSGGDVAALGYIKRILKVLTVYEAMPEAERNLLAGMYPDDVELQLEWVPGSAIRHGWRALMGAMDQRTRRYIEFEAEVRKWEDLQSARPKVKARRTGAAASTDTGGGIGAMNEGSETGAMNEGSETESAESSSASSSDESIPMGEYMMQSRTRVLALIEAEKALKDVGSSAPPPPSPIIMEPSPVATDGYKFDPASLGAPLGDTAAPSTPVPPSPSAVSLAPLESFKFLDVPPVASSGPSDHSVEPMVVEEERAPETPGPTAPVGAPISATESVPETPPPGEIPGPGYVPKAAPGEIPGALSKAQGAPAGATPKAWSVVPTSSPLTVPEAPVAVESLPAVPEPATVTAEEGPTSETATSSAAGALPPPGGLGQTAEEREFVLPSPCQKK